MLGAQKGIYPVQTVQHLLVTAKTPPTTAHMRTMKCRKEGGRSLTVTMMGDTSYMMSTAAKIPPECVNNGSSVNKCEQMRTQVKQDVHQGAHHSFS